MSHQLTYLTQQEVINLAPTLAESIDIVEGVLCEHGKKETANPAKPAVHPRPGAFIHAMPGFLRRRRQVGLKWVSGFFSNPKRGLPSLSGLIVLNDPDTGFPTAVMDCAYITALRTAAVSAVAARYLANQDAGTLGIVGSGLQGRYHLMSLKEVLPALRRVWVFDTSDEALRGFVADMSQAARIDIEPAASPKHATTHAEIVVTATSWLNQAIFKAEWVRPGALVLPVHSRGWDLAMLVGADKFVVDDWGQFSAALGGPGGFYHPLPQPYAELGEIVAGIKPGRERLDERIIDFNYGLAIHDVAMATEVLRRARQAGVGTPLPQLDGRMPFTS